MTLAYFSSMSYPTGPSTKIFPKQDAIVFRIANSSLLEILFSSETICESVKTEFVCMELYKVKIK